MKNIIKPIFCWLIPQHAHHHQRCSVYLLNSINSNFIAPFFPQTQALYCLCISFYLFTLLFNETCNICGSVISHLVLHSLPPALCAPPKTQRHASTALLCHSPISSNYQLQLNLFAVNSLWLLRLWSIALQSLLPRLLSIYSTVELVIWSYQFFCMKHTFFNDHIVTDPTPPSLHSSTETPISSSIYAFNLLSVLTAALRLSTVGLRVCSSVYLWVGPSRFVSLRLVHAHVHLTFYDAFCVPFSFYAFFLIPLCSILLLLFYVLTVWLTSMRLIFVHISLLLTLTPPRRACTPPLCVIYYCLLLYVRTVAFISMLPWSRIELVLMFLWRFYSLFIYIHLCLVSLCACAFVEGHLRLNWIWIQFYAFYINKFMYSLL